MEVVPLILGRDADVMILAVPYGGVLKWYPKSRIQGFWGHQPYIDYKYNGYIDTDLDSSLLHLNMHK